MSQKNNSSFTVALTLFFAMLISTSSSAAGAADATSPSPEIGMKLRAEMYAHQAGLSKEKAETLVRLYVPYASKSFELFKESCSVDDEMQSNFQAGTVSDELGRKYLIAKARLNSQQSEAISGLVSNLEKIFSQREIAMVMANEYAVLHGRSCSPKAATHP